MQGNFTLSRVGKHLYNIENVFWTIVSKQSSKSTAKPVEVIIRGSGSYGVANGVQRLQLKLKVSTPNGEEEALIDSGKQPIVKDFPVILVQNLNEGNRGAFKIQEFQNVSYSIGLTT